MGMGMSHPLDHRFDVADEDFLTFLDRLDAGMRASKMPYMISGGVAIQVHVAKNWCHAHRKTLADLAMDTEERRHLRSTNNIDMVLGRDVKRCEKLQEVYKYIVGNDGGLVWTLTPNKLMEVSKEGGGYKKPCFILRSEEKPDVERRVFLRVYEEPSDWKNEKLGQLCFLEEFDEKLYVSFFDKERFEDIELNYGEAKVKIRVMDPAYLLAIKAAIFRLEDVQDAACLQRLSCLAGKPISTAVVDEIMRRQIKSNKIYFGRDDKPLKYNPVLKRRFHDFQESVAELMQ